MNKKLIPLLNSRKLSSGSMIDCYNQAIVKDISCTITTRVNASNNIYVVEGKKYMNNNLRIRKLIPLECMKLMGFSKTQYNDISNFNDGAIYHVAGDSIVISCLMALFGELTDLDYRKIINDYVESEVING